jgi:hypothetical protein
MDIDRRAQGICEHMRVAIMGKGLDVQVDEGRGAEAGMLLCAATALWHELLWSCPRCFPD